MKNRDFYNWLDQLAQKKAAEWTRVPYRVDEDKTYTEMLNDPTYNYRTFYNLQPDQAQRMLTADPEAHFTDIGKTAYHPSFSDESYYSGRVSDYNPYGIIGGHWGGDEQGDTYTLSPSQLQHHWDIDRTRQYMNMAGDGGVRILMPQYNSGKSNIHINPANRGKLNATKKRTGKTTEELTHSKNPLTRKRAVFAQNARKWKH